MSDFSTNQHICIKGIKISQSGAFQVSLLDVLDVSGFAFRCFRCVGRPTYYNVTFEMAKFKDIHEQLHK